MISLPVAKHRMFYKLKHLAMAMGNSSWWTGVEGGGGNKPNCFNSKKKKKNLVCTEFVLQVCLLQGLNILNNVGIAVILEPVWINLQVKSQCLPKNV